ncbi:hypothetical protein Hypma_011176 [Hypsizygus marmoreus]|uniref:Uncharacterized protein n=1 Tax=Hypsizygus marmoreus TaxID=39966 RepID=A0A369JHE7_HYPMA|nr:hypothetical protein Hypma_011176 [Hypsizygus marmoreus]
MGHQSFPSLLFVALAERVIRMYKLLNLRYSGILAPAASGNVLHRPICSVDVIPSSYSSRSVCLLPNWPKAKFFSICSREPVIERPVGSLWVT